jgi:hypothetical protein
MKHTEVLQLQEILYRETSIIAPEDVTNLIEIIHEELGEPPEPVERWTVGYGHPNAREINDAKGERVALVTPEYTDRAETIAAAPELRGQFAALLNLIHVAGYDDDAPNRKGEGYEEFTEAFWSATRLLAEICESEDNRPS